MIQKKSDDAVSPVIGVMLMIVIVVIIAAVVTAFATGMMSETEAAPVAALDVRILESESALEGYYGPELFITHLSGDAVDTKDIELQFSWVCGVADCTSGGVHTSTYSADGFRDAHPEGIDAAKVDRCQALYVKSTMTPERTEYKSSGIDHYFGDVILIPGMKLTAQSELLTGHDNTNSIFMDAVFNNYITHPGGGGAAETHNIVYAREHVGEFDFSYNPECPACVAEAEVTGDNSMPCFSGMNYMSGNNDEEEGELLYDLRTGELICGPCGHPFSLCTGADNPNRCTCFVGDGSTSAAVAANIMDHLPAGTAVEVMIIHMPSDKAIYDKTVIVE